MGRMKIEAGIFRWFGTAITYIALTTGNKLYGLKMGPQIEHSYVPVPRIRQHTKILGAF